MSLTMHSASVPIFVRQFTALLACMDKAEQHAEARKFSPDNYLALRLAPDMLPFTNQIQITSDGAKGCIARLAQQEIPKWEDSEKTFAELRARIQKTIDYVQSVPASALDGSDARDVTIPRRSGELTLSGEAFLKQFVLPNFFFHVTTAYALLRHAGVEIGKRDYLGPF